MRKSQPCAQPHQDTSEDGTTEGIPQTTSRMGPLVFLSEGNDKALTEVGLGVNSDSANV